MQVRIKAEDVERIKKILRGLTSKSIEYNEPHFTLKLDRLKIDRKGVVKNILKPDNLAFVGVSESKNKNYNHIHDLYFKLSKNRIFKIPSSIKAKTLYLVTIFKIRKKVQDEAVKYYKK